LVPKVRRFFNAYLDADAFRRADIQKKLSLASLTNLKFDPPVTPSVQEDCAAALEIARRAAENLKPPRHISTLPEKNSVRAYAFRFALKLGNCFMQLACHDRGRLGRRLYRLMPLSAVRGPG
jgi:hypothetical protein